MSDEEIKFSFEGAKKSLNKAVDFFKQNKVATISVLVILAALVVVGILIRIQNIPLLHDQATGQYIPLALDPFYWLRMATTIVHTGGLPAIDPYRHTVGGVGFAKELTPWVIAGLYKLVHFFNASITLDFADIIYPVVAFALGVVVFYFLVQRLTKSKITSLIASVFLAVIPTYLYRTMAGFADHDALGTLMFLITILVYSLALEWLYKKRDAETDYKKDKRRKRFIIAGLFGAAVGFLSSTTLASWGGISEFIPMVVPLSFILMWILKMKNPNSGEKELPRLLIFYLAFVFFSIFSATIYGFAVKDMLSHFLLTPTSLLEGLTLGFVIIDFLIVKFADKIPIKSIKKGHTLWGLGITIVLGIIVLTIHRGGFGLFVGDIINTLIHPFGTGRVGLTVAENAQPYISDWISQTGPIFFWLFFAGIIAFGVNLSSKIKKKKRKVWFIVLWIFLIAGLLLSRLSSTSVLNGTSFLSKLFYLGSMVIFFIYCINLYIKEDLDFSPGSLILFSLTIFMLIAARGAARLIFTVTPFACLFVGYLVFSLGSYVKKSKDDLLKMILFLAVIGVLIASIFSFNNFINASIVQAKYTGPSADYEWQYSMQWVQNNTPLNATFAHWWDYGYWVEYLGNRSTIADGGHFEGTFMDHMIGRYMLTEPNPNITLSFLKSNNVSYMLIDPSDLGKYPAYSIIGSGAAGTDRYSSVPIMTASSSQTQTQGNSTIRVYQNVVPTDADIFYNTTQGQIFMPQGSAYNIGVVVNTTSTSGGSVKFSQPDMILYYNNQQFPMPLRYIYYNGQLIDFGSGYPGAAYILPTLSQTTTSYQIDHFGSIIYLSPKVFSSLFAQLYLMGDPMNKYPTINLAHSQNSQMLESLQAQGFNGNFIYYSGNFYGPLDIWKVSYPGYILSKEQFTQSSGSFGDNFDNLTVTS